MEHILRDLTTLLNRYLRKDKLKGYYIRVKGRFKRGRRKKTLLKRKGMIAFNSLHLKLNTGYGILYTKFGVSGVKIVFAH